MTCVSQDSGGTKGGLPRDAAFNKPKAPGKIPSNTAHSPVSGASNGYGGGTALKGGLKSLNRQEKGCC